MDKSTRKDILKFALTIGAVLITLGLLSILKGRDYNFLFLLAAVLILLGNILPGVVRPFYKAWFGLSKLLGLFSTTITLTILFFLVLSPIAVLMKFLGKDPMSRDTKSDSYWIPKKSSPRKSDYEKQF